MNVTPSSLLHDRRSSVGPFLAASVFGHAAVLAFGLAYSWAFAGPKVDLDQKPITASLVRLGKPRDEKLLPTKEEPKAPPEAKPEPVPEPVAAPPPAPAAVAIPSKDVKPDDVKKTKTADTEVKDSKKSLFDAMKKVARGGKPEESEGAADGDVNGDSARQEGEKYYGLLSAVVKRNYDVSDTIDEAERRTLKALVSIRLGASGELLSVKLTKRSGNELFDSAVVSAVNRAAPFGPPPEHLRDSLKTQGVTFAFAP
jgi:TonB family protein